LLNQEDAFDPLAAGRLLFCFFMIVVLGSVGFFFFAR
jgi:hypothetical protein